MAHLPNLQLRPDLVAAAFPDNGRSGSRTGSVKDSGNKLSGYQAMKAKDTLYFNSLVDRHTVQKPAVKKHLPKMGFTAIDGTVYPTREEQIEADHINRLLEERAGKLKTLSLREQSHLRHLKNAARLGEITFTKDGVFENNPCEDCHINHEVAARLNTLKPPCPSSYMGRKQAEEQEREAKRLLNRRPPQTRESVFVQTSCVETGHIQTQTSRKDGSNVTTQTSKRRLPNQSTQTSQRTLPEVGVQTSLVCRPVETISRESSSASSCVSRYCSRESWCGQSSGPTLSGIVSSTSCEDCKETLRLYINELMLENEELDEYLTLQMISLEEDALYETIAKETCSYNKALQMATNVRVDEARAEYVDRATLEKGKSAYSAELKRNTALKAILAALADEQDRMNASIEKQKAAQRVKEEQRKMDELIAEQVKLRIKKKLEEELEERRQMLATADMELADIVEAQKRAELALHVAEKQQAKPQRPEIRRTLSGRPVRLLRRQTSRQVSPKSSGPALIPMSPTQRDVSHAIGLLDQIKHDMGQMFPNIGALLQEKIPTNSSHQRVPSGKSQVEKLPSVTCSNPVNMVAAPMASEDVVESARSFSQRPSRISPSTLSTVSLMWKNAVEEAELKAAPQAEAVQEAVVEIASQAIEAAVPQAQIEQSIENASQTMQEAPVEAASRSSLMSRPSSIECCSSEALRINEGRQRAPSPLESQASLYERPPSIECRSSEALRIDEGRQRAPSPVTPLDSQTSLYERPPSIECRSSEALRIDEGRQRAPSPVTPLDSQTSLYERPPSIECRSSEALRIDEGRVPEPMTETNKYESASTLGILSSYWDTIQREDDIDCPPSGSGLSAESECLSSPKEGEQDNTTNDTSSYSTLGCLSDQWSQLNSAEEPQQEEPQPPVQRVPTPPAYPRPAGYPVRGVISCHSSLRQIKENSASDFSTEFVSPLAIHAQAMVPYQSQRTRLGLKKYSELTSNEKQSREKLAQKEEQLRENLIDLLPPKRTIEEFYAEEAEANPMPCPPSPASVNSEPAELQGAENVCSENAATCTSITTETRLEETVAPKNMTEDTLDIAEPELKEEENMSTENTTCIPRTETKTSLKSDQDNEDDKPLCDEYSATCLQETSSTYMFSAGSATLAKINASVARLRAKAASASEPIMPVATPAQPPADCVPAQPEADASISEPAQPEADVSVSEPAQPEADVSVSEPATEETTVPQKNSNISTWSSRTGSTASLKEAVAAEEATVCQVSSNVSTRSSKKGSRASLKEDMATEEKIVPQMSSNVSTRSQSSASLKKEAVAAEETSIPQVSSNVSTRSSRKGSSASLKKEAVAAEEKIVPQVSSDVSTRSSKKGSRASLRKEAVAAEETTVPQVSSNVSARSSKKGSRASLKKEAVPAEETTVPQVSSNVSTRSSRKGSSASLKKEAVATKETTVPQVSTNVSAKSSKKGSRASLKEAMATEGKTVPQMSSNVPARSSRKGSSASLKKEAVAAEETTVPTVSSNVSTRSSKKGSSASLKKEAVAAEETTVPQVSSNVSTRSSKKGSRASLKEAVATEGKTVPQVSSNVSTRSSKKGSSASLKKEAVAAEETTVPQVSSNVSSRSSRKGSSASLKKEAVAAEGTSNVPGQSSKASLKFSKKGSQTSINAVPQSASKASIRSSRKGSSTSVKRSLPVVATKDISEMTKSASKPSSPVPEKMDAQAAPTEEVVVSKTSTVSTAPSDVSVESYMESLSPKGKMSFGASPVVTPTASKKSLTSVKSALKPILLPSQMKSTKDLTSKQSTVSITPSEVSVESYMESLSPKGTKTNVGDAPVIKSPTASKKSLTSVKSSLKSLMLPSRSQMSAKMTKKPSESSRTGSPKTSPKVSTSSIRSN